jgi:endoribonuclease Dicer
MIEKNNFAHRDFLERIRQAEERMNDWRKTDVDSGNVPPLPPTSTTQQPDDDDNFDCVNDNETFTVSSTGASVSYTSAIKLVHYYCALLPQDGFTVTKTEFVYKEEHGLFTATLMMPPSCPFRTMESKIVKSKTLAKRSAAFEACKKLHELQALDQHLLPIRIDEDFTDINREHGKYSLKGSWYRIRAFIGGDDA